MRFCNCTDKYEYLLKNKGLPSSELRKKLRESPPIKIEGLCKCCKTNINLRPWTSFIKDENLYCVNCWWINKCYLIFVRHKYKNITEETGKMIEKDVSERYNIKLPYIDNKN